MACGPFGCGGDKGQKLETCGILLVLVAGTMIAGELWFEGRRLAAGGAAAAALTILFGGPFLSSCLDAVGVRVLGAWRVSGAGRRAGRLYCPECGGTLQAAQASGFPAAAECPSCRGSWCASGELAKWVDAEGGGRVWQAHPKEGGALPSPCPKCSAALESGNWTGLSTFSRCEPCGSHWVPRLARVRLELDRSATRRN